MFSRVHHALSGGEGLATEGRARDCESLEDMEGRALGEVRRAWENVRSKREAEEAKEEDRLARLREEERLATDRRRLQHRFDPDSEDAAGEDPFAAAGASATTYASEYVSSWSAPLSSPPTAPSVGATNADTGSTS